MPTIWISPTGYVTGDSSLSLGYPSVAQPSTTVTCTAPGDLKWVFLALNLPSLMRIMRVTVCYQLSDANSFISQVRLTQMSAPNDAEVIHDDPTELKSTKPICYTSTVGGTTPALGPAVTLALRLFFQDISHRILLGVGVTYQPLGECSFSVTEFGATGDGITDDTVALQAVFAAVPPQGAHVCVPPGTYLVSSTLALKSNTYLKGVGRGSLFKRTAAGAETLFFSENVSGVTVESISIDLNGAGSGQPKNFATGMAFRSLCSNIRIRDTRVFDGTGTTVLGRHAILVLESDHVLIEDNYVSDGLRIKAGGVGDRLVIRNNFVEDPNDNGITIATHVGQTRTVNYVIQGNTVRAAKGTSIYIGDDGFGVLDHPDVSESGIVYQNILVDGNILLGPVGSGQSMITVHLATATERLHIVNNVLANSGVLQQYTQGIESSIQTPFGRPGADVLIAGNSIEGNFDHGAIWMRSWNRVRIAYNQVSNGSSNGIRLGAVDNATIIGNIVSNCARGILAEDATHLIATGNSLRELSEQGVLLLTSDASKTTSLHCTGNQVSGNADAGIVEQGPGTFDTHYLFNDLRGNAAGAFQNINANATMTGNLT